MREFVCSCGTEFKVEEKRIVEREFFLCPFCKKRIKIKNTVRKNSPENYLALYESGKSISEIAEVLSVKEMTVRNNLLNLYVRGDIEEIDFMSVSPESEAVIRGVIDNVGIQLLRTIKENCPDSISYDEIAFVVAMYKKENNFGSQA